MFTYRCCQNFTRKLITKNQLKFFTQKMLKKFRLLTSSVKNGWDSDNYFWIRRLGEDTRNCCSCRTKKLPFQVWDRKRKNSNLAERGGFEPPVPNFRDTCFPSKRVKPLRHLSMFNLLLTILKFIG